MVAWFSLSYLVDVHSARPQRSTIRSVAYLPTFTTMNSRSFIQFNNVGNQLILHKTPKEKLGVFPIIQLKVTKFILLVHVGDIPLNALDAKAAAFLEQGDYVVMSPNMIWIPRTPPLSRYIAVRADGSFSGNDPGFWPQCHSNYFIFHMCIPSTARGEGDFGFGVRLWQDAEPKEWDILPDEMPGIYSATDIVHEEDCLGFIKKDIVDPLYTLYWSSVQKAEKEVADCKINKRWKYVREQGDSVFERLRQCPQPMFNSIIDFCNAQQCTLLAAGFINYSTVVLPRLQDPGFRAEMTLPYQGAFTANVALTQLLFRIGVPVWYV